MHSMSSRDAITEKIRGLCRKPEATINKWDRNFERPSHAPLHSPPFWWGQKPTSNKPWQCWSLEDYGFKNCKWDGCYRPCSCRQMELNIAMTCRTPDQCGFHQQSKKNCNNCCKFEEEKQNTRKNLCCYCKLKTMETHQEGVNSAMPDPRCLGQYHSSLLENILGRGTALAIGQTKCLPTDKDDCLIRGYIPGDVHGWKGWSSCVGRDPLYEELSNSVYPIELSPTDVYSTKLNKKKNVVTCPPHYDHYCQDHRYQYGIGPEQLHEGT